MPLASLYSWFDSSLAKEFHVENQFGAKTTPLKISHFSFRQNISVQGKLVFCQFLTNSKKNNLMKIFSSRCLWAAQHVHFAKMIGYCLHFKNAPICQTNRAAAFYLTPAHHSSSNYYAIKKVYTYVFGACQNLVEKFSRTATKRLYYYCVSMYFCTLNRTNRPRSKKKLTSCWISFWWQARGRNIIVL